jgi:hypothetical protein
MKKLEPEIVDAIEAIRRRKRDIRNSVRRAAKLSREDVNVFGSRLARLNFHSDDIPSFDKKWS